MTQTSHFKYPATIDNLQNILGNIVQFAREVGLNDKKVSELQIAAEEALVNIFHYAYPDAPGDIEIFCSENNGDVTVDLVDSGIPFDSTKLEDPDTSLDISDRKIGGLGVHLMKHLTDSIQYRREAGHNILGLVKKIC